MYPAPQTKMSLFNTVDLFESIQRIYDSSNGLFTLHGNETRNDRFLYYAMYCTHYTATGTGTKNQCFLFYPSRSRSRAVCMSHKGKGASVPTENTGSAPAIVIKWLPHSTPLLLECEIHKSLWRKIEELRSLMDRNDIVPLKRFRSHFPPSIHRSGGSRNCQMGRGVNPWAWLKIPNIYRPQRSCGQGNIFTPVSHSVHRGGLPQCMF